MKSITCCGLVLLLALASCKKSGTSEEPKDQKTIKSIQENYLGTTTPYVLTYNNLEQLVAYESLDKKFKAQYRYEQGKPKWISYKKDTVTYELLLNYAANEALENSTFTTTWASGKIKEEPITVTTTGGEIKLSFFNDIYSCIIQNNNLIHASFDAWYFKRKVNLSYGAEPGPVFGTGMILPDGELNHPLLPSSDLFTSIFHMLLSAFSRNNITAVNSDLYTRSIRYAKDETGRVTAAAIHISKKLEDRIEVLDSKLITYHY